MKTGGSLAICPELQGCYTEGETEAEARSLIEDAIRLHVEERLSRAYDMLTVDSAEADVEKFFAIQAEALSRSECPARRGRRVSGTRQSVLVGQASSEVGAETVGPGLSGGDARGAPFG